MRRSPEDLAKMRRAGRVVAEMHDSIRAALRPGTTTAALDRIGRDVLERRGARSNFLGYRGTFPGVICASPNDVIVHGIPGPYVLQEGDIVSIDCGAIVDGWHGDAAFTAGVGTIAPEAAALIDATERSLEGGIAAMQPGGRLSDIGAAVQAVAEAAGFAVVKEYTGHGIGLAMHEPPDVPNWGRPGKGRRLAPGQTYAVEPMLCARRADTLLLDDGWTVVTADGSLAAHAEHTIAITDDGPEVLTARS
ncbi:MAG TPA: type I methionyl aminopeptidase [Acidimicrobiales bacterium]|nr:type I methionyl aminopeptidase [Acidimicrobiales bacterium]